MLINPRETVDAARAGITLWYSILLPALLPFFISAELMISSGLAAFLGVLLEPVMQPLFRLPGCSSLVVAMGFTSGFPVGAVMTRRLYEEKLITAGQAERLVSFTNNSSPLFIIGAIGVGMFASPMIGYILALAHYLSNLLVGLLWRFMPNQEVITPRCGPLFDQAWKALKDHPNPGPGKLLGDAIKNSLNNILAIAGFVVFFSLITRMLSVTGVIEAVAHGLNRLGVSLSYPLGYACITGFFEITLGARAVAGIDAALFDKILVLSGILAFSGCSIITQVMSIMTGMPVRLSFYLVSRLIQMGLSLLISYLAWLNLNSWPALQAGSFTLNKVLYSFDAWSLALYCLLGSLVFLILLTFLSTVLWFKNRLS